MIVKECSDCEASFDGLLRKIRRQATTLEHAVHHPRRLRPEHGDNSMNIPPSAAQAKKNHA